MFPQRLTDGYRAFLDERFPREQERFRSLAEKGQTPEVLVIGCCDSRVAPEAIFDAGPGELFVVRNVANLVPPYETGGEYHGTSAALEFAVQALHVKHIVVLGHESCGGIKAYVKHSAPLSTGDFIGRWMSVVAPADAPFSAEERLNDNFIRRMEFAAIEMSLRNLMTFPWVRDRVERGELELHGAYFGVANGVLQVRDPETGQFSAAVPDVAGRVNPVRAW